MPRRSKKQQERPEVYIKPGKKTIRTNATCQPALAIVGPDLPIRYLYTGNGIRDNCLKLFYQSLLDACDDKDNESTRLNMSEIAKKIEEGIYANTGSNPYDDKYKSCCRSKLWNLRDKRNSEFVSNVISGTIKAEEVYKLTGDEMLSREKFYQKQLELKKIIENSIRYESDLVPLKLESDGSLGSCMSGGSGGTVWVSRDMITKSNISYD